MGGPSVPIDGPTKSTGFKDGDEGRRPIYLTAVITTTLGALWIFCG